MTKIALFCEGVSENRILTYIMQRYMGDDVTIDGIYPATKESRGRVAQDDFGGWKAVLDHCNEKDFDSALDGHDYLVVQIDTDTCNEVNYDVRTISEYGKALSDETVYERVKERILRDIPIEKRTLYEGKILFAVCFNETECWLLPLYYENDRKNCEKTNNCIFTLNQALNRQGLGIPDKAKNTPNAIRVYDKILKGFKPKNIQKFSQYNFGFRSFVNQLDEIKEKS